MWDFAPKTEISIPLLCKKIEQYRSNIEGITILGGEPLDQYRETLSLLKWCNEFGISAILFTGYEISEIEKKGMADVLKNLDIVITGRYEEQYRTLYHQWIGSTNQTVHFLSDRYRNYTIENKNYTELSINEDGSITILGFPLEDISNIYEKK